MDALGLFWHLANFVAPALFVAVINALLCKVFWSKGLARVPLRTLVWQSAAAGLAVLVLGLVLTGHVGRMLTYAALVVVCALVPWLKVRRLK